MSHTPAEADPDDVDTDQQPERLLLRDLLGTTAWALVAAVRSGTRITSEADAVALVNRALAAQKFCWRLRPLH